MKTMKSYITPQTEVNTVCSVQMICQSPAVPDNGVGVSNGVLPENFIGD